MKKAKAQKQIPDFSVKEIAQQNQNKTALIGVTIMNAILAIAYVLESSQMQNKYVNETADSFRQIHTSTQNISQQVTHLRETVDIVTDENRQVSEQIEQVSEIMQRVTAGADMTCENCSINLDSVANVAVVMDNLSLEAAKLQN